MSRTLVAVELWGTQPPSEDARVWTVELVYKVQTGRPRTLFEYEHALALQADTPEEAELAARNLAALYNVPFENMA